MLRISIQKAIFLTNQDLNPLSHLFILININHDEENTTIIHSIMQGQISTIEHLFHKFQEEKVLRNIVIQQDGFFIFKEKVHLSWGNGIFPAQYEDSLKSMLEGNKGAKQLALITNPNHNQFDIKKTLFEKGLVISGDRWVDLTIEQNTFLEEITIENFEGNVYSQNNIYRGSIKIQNLSFSEKREIRFNGGDLSKLIIENSHIERAFFNQMKIDQGIFVGNTFAKQANFYGSTFEQCPNFAQCQFEGNINLVNTNLIFDFEEMEKQIDMVSNNEDKHLVANDFRDSFRLFKNTLSKEGNILDASNYNKIELYCKEVELDSKPQKTWRDWIDWAQLFFYRNTSDHHTDLAKIFNNVIMLIALFGIFASILLPFAPSPEPSTMRFIQEGGGELSIFDLKTLHPQSSGYKMGRWAQWLCSFIACVGFVGIYFGFIAMTNWFRSIQKKWAKVCLYVFYTLVYLFSLTFLFYKPPLLLPIIGKFFDESLKLNFAPLQSLCIVYYILMFLMLFSFQKTARKNSIIPS